MFDDCKTMKRYCDRLGKAVEVERKGKTIVINCPYFKIVPKGPACKRVLFGRLGHPIPLPKSAAKTISRMMGMAFLDAVKVNLGISNKITWHCLLCN